jgi:predicted MPP superfamily phosphohydrolase
MAASFEASAGRRRTARRRGWSGWLGRFPRIVLLLALLHAYIGWRIVPDLGVGAGAAALMSAWLIVSCVAMPLGFMARRLPRDATSDRLAWTGLLAAGSFSSLFVLTVLRDVLLAVADVVTHFAPATLAWHELVQQSAIAVPLSTIALTVVGFVNARRRARVRRVDVPIADLPAALHGFTIAQISDVHVGPTIKGDFLAAVVDTVNALQPDAIAITGDLVDGSVSDLGAHTAVLAQLRARHGTFFVTGNHEYYSGAHAWIEELRRLGVRVLLNEHVTLEHNGERVVVAGVTDYSAEHFDPRHRSDPARAIAGAAPDAGVRVLLAHQPRSAFAAANEAYDLQLSGHTHGGQFLPWTFFVRLQQPFTAGLHKLRDLWVYTSRGTGYWGPPKRLGAPSEITCIRLVPA